MSIDTLIRGARVVDGTGASSFQGDLAIFDGRIVALGDAASALGAADCVVDADGLVLAPGFWDIHTHYDVQLLWDPRKATCQNEEGSMNTAAEAGRAPTKATARPRYT